MNVLQSNGELMPTAVLVRCLAMSLMLRAVVPLNVDSLHCSKRSHNDKSGVTDSYYDVAYLPFNDTSISHSLSTHSVYYEVATADFRLGCVFDALRRRTVKPMKHYGGITAGSASVM